MKGSKFINLVKNAKQADKKRKPERTLHAPGHGLKRAGVITFWFLFAIMFISFVVNAFGPRGESAAEVAMPEVVENPAVSVEAVDFAKMFAGEYFTWSATGEGFASRAETLAPYLAKGVDGNAGLQTSQEFNSSLKSAQVLRVQEVSENRALITLKVVQGLSKQDEKETAVHSFTVPVAFNQSYAVYALPSFTAVSKAHTVEMERIKGEAVPGETEENVKAFLPTFFQSYAEDAPDKLSYFLQTEGVAQGLQGSVVFEEMRDVTMVAGQDGEIVVAAGVVMKEPKSGGLYLTQYLLSVKETDGHYIVTKLNEGVE